MTRGASSAAGSLPDARVHCAEREGHLLDLTGRTRRHRGRRGVQAGADDWLPRTPAL